MRPIFLPYGWDVRFLRLPSSPRAGGAGRWQRQRVRKRSGQWRQQVPIKVSGEAEETSSRELGTGVQLRRRTGRGRGGSLMEEEGNRRT